MKNLTFSKVMLIALMAILPLSFYAQKKQNYPVEKYFYIFAEGGLSINHTDLANYGFIPFYQNNKFTFNDGYVFKNFDGQLGLGYQMGKVIGINAKFGIGKLGGEKHNQELTVIGNPQTYYDLQLMDTKFMEANLNLTFNLTNLFFGYNPRRVVNFIPHIGIGGIRYKAGAVNQIPTLTTTSGGTVTNIAPAKTDAEMTFTVPVGAEINFNVAKKLDIFLDYTFTFAGNDKLDQTTKAKDDIQVINDMYSSLNLGLRFKFNNPTDIDRMARNANEIGMRCNPDPLQEQDGKVCFDVIFDVPANYFEKYAVMNVTPSFSYKGGQLDLDPVTFVGEKVKGGDFQVSYSNGGQFTKHYCVDYVPELESSVLNANPMFYVYNGTIYPTQEEIVKNAYFAQGGERKLADGVVVPAPPKCEVKNIRTNVQDNTITVSWMGDAESYDLYITNGDAPAADTKPTVAGLTQTSYTFNDLEAGEFRIFVKANCANDNFGEWQGTKAAIAPVIEPICIYYFDYNKSDILGNGKSVRDRNKTARKQLAEKAAEGKTFRIEAWASPEGELELNNRLADDRGNAAVKDIKAQLKKEAGNYEYNAKGNGPDWNKFIELVQNSNIADMDQIIRVIQNSKNREQEIKNMINVYPELEKDILPLIRRAEVYLQ